AVPRHQSDDHVEGGRLAGTVGSEQADDLAAFHFQRNAVDHGTFAVALDEACCFQHCHVQFPSPLLSPVPFSGVSFSGVSLPGDSLSDVSLFGWKMRVTRSFARFSD